MPDVTSRERAIIHLNIADFAARIEAGLSPQLANRPLVVAPAGAARARVYDMNERAFREGIRKGMPLARAVQHHPGIPILPPRLPRYSRVMQDLFRQACAFTPLIEAGETDGHLFLDITGASRLMGPPQDVAWRLRRAVKKHLGLDPIWTLATSKHVAKAASRIVKPLGEYIVRPGDEERFLAHLPIDLLPGLLGAECRTLMRFNIINVSQARCLSKAHLAVPFGTRASLIHSLLRGMDNTPVGNGRTAVGARDTEIAAAHEFGDDTNDTGRIKAALALLTARICHRLSQADLRAGQLTLILTYSDGVVSCKNDRGGPAGETELLARAWGLFMAARPRRVRIRHIRLHCSTGPSVPVQALLFADTPVGPDIHHEKDRRLTRAMERIRDRFGTLAIHSGAVLGLPAPPEQAV